MLRSSACLRRARSCRPKLPLRDLAEDLGYVALARVTAVEIDKSGAGAEAIHDQRQAEKITPELIDGHHGARVVTRELLQRSGLRPRPELRDLAERFGVLP
jgi:hypothetical protein